MPLTDIKCRSLKARQKQYKAADTEGLYLLITPSSRKYWRINYRLGSKSKTLAIGVYPQVSLKEARQQRDTAHKLLAEGKDPSLEKKKAKIQQQLDTMDIFEAIAMEWLNARKENLSINHFKQLKNLLLRDINPVIGKLPMNTITAPQLLLALRKIEDRGALDMARKARQCCGQIFRYGIAIGKAERDIAHDLRGALKTRKVKNRAYLSKSELPEFFDKLQKYDGERVTALTLEFIALTFVRTKELRHAPWDEFDFETRLWRIPAERMKMDRPHLVPLSRQAMAVLEDLHRLTGHYHYLAPNSRTPSKAMSENTMLFAMYRMGYHSRATVHGFRATASTILHENGFNSDIIERQLAHVEGNKVKAAYNHAEYLNERTEMMQWWADHLDSFKALSS